MGLLNTVSSPLALSSKQLATVPTFRQRKAAKKQRPPLAILIRFLDDYYTESDNSMTLYHGAENT